MGWQSGFPHRYDHVLDGGPARRIDTPAVNAEPPRQKNPDFLFGILWSMKLTFFGFGLFETVLCRPRGSVRLRRDVWIDAGPDSIQQMPSANAPIGSSGALLPVFWVSKLEFFAFGTGTAPSGSGRNRPTHRILPLRAEPPRGAPLPVDPIPADLAFQMHRDDFRDHDALVAIPLSVRCTSAPQCVWCEEGFLLGFRRGFAALRCPSGDPGNLVDLAHAGQLGVHQTPESRIFELRARCSGYSLQRRPIQLVRE